MDKSTSSTNTYTHSNRRIFSSAQRLKLFCRLLCPLLPPRRRCSLDNQEKAMMNLNLTGVRVCVFDAYGTLFDVNSAAQQAQKILHEKWQRLAEVWRTKQLQYTWLRSLTGSHVDFWQLTVEALEFALDSMKLGNAQMRDQWMEHYLQLSAYPDVTNTLVRLKTVGLKCAILSNGSPRMLAAAVKCRHRRPSQCCAVSRRSEGIQTASHSVSTGRGSSQPET